MNDHPPLPLPGTTGGCPAATGSLAGTVVRGDGPRPGPRPGAVGDARSGSAAAPLPADRPSEPSAAAGLARQSLQVRELEEALAAARTGAIHALSMLLDLKDLKTGLHATRLATWAVRVGEHLGLGPDQLRDVEVASVLHDIGKVGVPDAILLKPGRLTEREIEVVRKHPEHGWALLRRIPGLERVSLLVLHHHERFDGGGYPSGLRGPQIPLGARIVAVVDTFDAMLSDRPYRRGLAVREVLRRLRPERNAQFDAAILDLFLDLASAARGRDR